METLWVQAGSNRYVDWSICMTPTYLQDATAFQHRRFNPCRDLHDIIQLMCKPGEFARSGVACPEPDPD